MKFKTFTVYRVAKDTVEICTINVERCMRLPQGRLQNLNAKESLIRWEVYHGLNDSIV